MASFNISLDYPEIASATKSIEKNQANILLKTVQDITIKGNLLAINNASNYTAIWDQINAISDNSTAKNCTLNFANLVSYSGAKILNINFDETKNQDVKSKNFSITFQIYEAVTSSMLTSYGVSLKDLKDLADIKIKQSKEENMEGTNLTTSVNLSFNENTSAFSKGRAEAISKVILAATNALTLTASRTTSSNIYDEKTASYTFIETKNKFRGSSGGFAILRSNNYNIQNNGAINVTETEQIKIEKNTYTIGELYSKADSDASGAKSRCIAFINLYYNLSYGAVPAQYRNVWIESSRQITVDEAPGTAQYTVSITNEPEYSNNVRVEIVNTIEDLKKEDSKRKITRGTITGIGSPPNKELALANNKKLSYAKTYFDTNYKPKFVQAKTYTDRTSEVSGAKYKTYITNGDVSYNISEGSISFSLTYESKPTFTVKTATMLHGSAEISTESAVNLANQFIVIGGLSPGEELIQQGAQAKPINENLKVQGVFKSAKDLQTYISTFKDLVKNVYANGIIRSINVSANLIERSFQASASWFKFGEYRERSSFEAKVTAKSEVQI
jgi:hypothetical protein